MAGENYRKLFVDIDKSRNDVVDIIQRITNGKKSTHFVDCDWASFDARDNEEFSRRKIAGDGADGFLYYKYIIDCEKTQCSENMDNYIHVMREIIRVLRDFGAKVVAACDFEDRLRTGEVSHEIE
jgi:hypothetical protein